MQNESENKNKQEEKAIEVIAETFSLHYLKYYKIRVRTANICNALKFPVVFIARVLDLYGICLVSL